MDFKLAFAEKQRIYWHACIFTFQIYLINKVSFFYFLHVYRNKIKYTEICGLFKSMTTKTTTTKTWGYCSILL